MLWTLTEALRVLRGQAKEIRIEPFNEDARGLEFRITAGRRNSWHQCKRRLRSGSWTISALDSDGVLGDFARKLADSANDCVFVSSDPAAILKTLSGKAAVVDSASAFLDSLGKDDQLNLQGLAKAWPLDPETLFDWLRRVRVETVSETSLKRELTGLCELLFTVSPDQAIERLATFLDEKVTHVITTEGFRAAVDSLGLGWQARFDSTLKEKLAAATDSYLDSLAQPIAGVEIDTPELTETVAVALTGPGRLTVVSGSAGSGKSLALRRTVAAARERGWSVLGFRVDWFLDAPTVGDIGARLVGRKENPVAVLGNHSVNADCLLVFDQVDAVSEASGRSGRIRELVFQMINAARHYPGLRVVLACRTYDLDNDDRLKALEKDVKAATVRMKPLDWTTAVQPVLQRLRLGTRDFSDRQREILSVAINLQIFATLAIAGEVLEGDLTGAQLFDRLLEVRAREMRRDGIGWTPHAPLTLLANWMSENQVLTAPANVVAAFPGAADVLNSYGLVTNAGGKIQFAHESFFDHMFSADFVRRGGSVLVLLKGDQQRLFRRTQVRQIFARLRDQGGRASYLAILREVMESVEVRYLVKDAVASWLASVEAPVQAELKLVEGWLERGHSYERLARMVVNARSWLPLLVHSGTVGRWTETGGSRRDLASWLLRKGAVEHASLVSTYLRGWWHGEALRTAELLAWFNNLHPNGPIGELEELYSDVIAAAPADALKEQFEANFDLGAWVHKDRAPGARVLGWWLARWMTVFSDSHPFARSDAGNDRYWIKELADHAPMAFLDAVWPSFAEGLRRERLALTAKRLGTTREQGPPT